MITLISNDLEQRIRIALFDKMIDNNSIYFSFNLINELTNKETLIAGCTDISLHRDRYSEFIMLNHGLDNGFYTYQVLEMNETLITIGRLQVLNDSFSETKVIRYEDYNGEFKAYQG